MRGMQPPVVQQCKSCRKLGTVLMGSLISCGFLRLFFRPGRMQVALCCVWLLWAGRLLRADSILFGHPAGR